MDVAVGDSIYYELLIDKATTAKLALLLIEHDVNYLTLKTTIVNANADGFLSGTYTVSQGSRLRLKVAKDDGGDLGIATYYYLDDVKMIKKDIVIREESNYYPFGLKHKGYNNITNGTHHPYGFGGKEEQNELGLGWVDITARNYDPALGRWMNIDPLAEQMRRHSPYNYGFDNPIYFMDYDGMAPQGPNDVITEISNTRKVGNQVRRDIRMIVTVSVVNLTGADLSKTMFNKKSGTVRLNNFEGNTAGYDSSTREYTIDNITEFNIEYNVVTSLDDIGENDHVLLISEKINGDSNSGDVTESTVGLADRPGRVSTVEDGTIADGSFDEVAQHEIGHNLGLEHSDLGDLMFETVNGNTNLSKKKKGDIVGGQISAKQGNGTVKESSKYKKSSKKAAGDFIFLNEIDFKK